MEEDNGNPKGAVPVARIVQCTVIRCRQHAKEARYRVKWYEKDRLVEVECLECHPPTPICRFAIDNTRVIS